MVDLSARLGRPTKSAVALLALVAAAYEAAGCEDAAPPPGDCPPVAIVVTLASDYPADGGDAGGDVLLVDGKPCGTSCTVNVPPTGGMLLGSGVSFPNACDLYLKEPYGPGLRPLPIQLTHSDLLPLEFGSCATTPLPVTLSVTYYCDESPFADASSSDAFAD